MEEHQTCSALVSIPAVPAAERVAKQGVTGVGPGSAAGGHERVGGTFIVFDGHVPPLVIETGSKIPFFPLQKLVPPLVVQEVRVFSQPTCISQHQLRRLRGASRHDDGGADRLRSGMSCEEQVRSAWRLQRSTNVRHRGGCQVDVQVQPHSCAARSRHLGQREILGDDPLDSEALGSVYAVDTSRPSTLGQRLRIQGQEQQRYEAGAVAARTEKCGPPSEDVASKAREEAPSSGDQDKALSSRKARDGLPHRSDKLPSRIWKRQGLSNSTLPNLHGRCALQQARQVQQPENRPIGLDQMRERRMQVDELSHTGNIAVQAALHIAQVHQQHLQDVARDDTQVAAGPVVMLPVGLKDVV
mmetsp:Transcript_83701/g.240574  ORF Transcript_83701/g.240574 Transcript_83701/m.240574 type:complete len:357 (+) Transcript_83701:973-2043(+)